MRRSASADVVGTRLKWIGVADHVVLHDGNLTDLSSLIRILLRGAQSVATDAAPTAPAMPSFGWKLSDDEAAAALTYIRNAWGNAAAPVAASDVKRARHDLSARAE